MAQHTQPPATGFVIFHYGPMPIDAMIKAQKLLPKDAVMDTNVARMAGASFAFGAPTALDAARARLETDALARAERAHPELGEDARRWIAIGQHGISSLALFHAITYGEPLKDEATPRDMADFGRCERMPQAVPSFREQMAGLGKVEPVWARLIAAWESIATAMDEGILAGDSHTPKAAALLQQALES